MDGLFPRKIARILQRTHLVGAYLLRTNRVELLKRPCLQPSGQAAVSRVEFVRPEPCSCRVIVTSLPSLAEPAWPLNLS